jgi:hypothetical protein
MASVMLGVYMLLLVAEVMFTLLFITLLTCALAHKVV